VRDAQAVAEGRVLVLRLDGVEHAADPEAPDDVAELERLCLALELLDALDAASAPGCWRAPTVGLA
jgi:hypothetical protein